MGCELGRLELRDSAHAATPALQMPPRVGPSALAQIHPNAVTSNGCSSDFSNIIGTPPRGQQPPQVMHEQQTPGPPSTGWWPTPVHRQAPPQHMPTAPELPSGQNGIHLATWMASTERELRELRWMLGSSAARLDEQHGRLMGELDKLRSQLDMWERNGGCSKTPTPAEETRLEVLEARFDALAQLVGREQSECAQMWRLVEVAAGTSPPGVAPVTSSASPGHGVDGYPSALAPTISAAPQAGASLGPIPIGCAARRYATPER